MPMAGAVGASNGRQNSREQTLWPIATIRREVSARSVFTVPVGDCFRTERRGSTVHSLAASPSSRNTLIALITAMRSFRSSSSRSAVFHERPLRRSDQHPQIQDLHNISPVRSEVPSLRPVPRVAQLGVPPGVRPWEAPRAAGTVVEAGHAPAADLRINPLGDANAGESPRLHA